MRHFSLNSCATVDQLYTYVLGLYELEGFYLCNEWFIALSADELGLVSRIVRCRMDPLATTQTVQTSSSHHEFGELMLSVVNSQSNTRFATMCFLITTVARLLPEMEESLPDWVFAASVGNANAQ